ncbi:glycosyltransferase [Microbacterium sp. MMO-10]|uniref:glycosyltransferase n=1 Tax=Microbacterium sp. MMO-10 TaxID=3081272 RepID=UPI0030159AAC
MLTRLRRLWRAARSLPVLRPLLGAADRLWWARTIRRARVVDVAYVALQLGRAVSPRGAVRAYVTGGFRRGLSLNPLFSERLVSEQLPDSARVPALYAYLVTDPARIDTSLAWDAPAHAARADSAAVPGSPLASAWRALEAGASVPLRGGARVDLADLHAAARSVLEGSADASPVDLTGASLVLRWTLDAADADAAALRAPLEVLDAEGADRDSRRLVLAVGDAPADVRLLAAQLALGDPRIVLTERISDSPGAVAAGVRVIERDSGGNLDAASLHALVSASGGPVAPIWLGPDGTVVSAGILVRDGRPWRAWSGHPREDVEGAAAEIAVAALDAPVRAYTAGRDGEPRTLTAAAVRGRAPSRPPLMPADAEDSPAPAARRGLVLSPPGDVPRMLRHPESFALPDGTVVPRLRWAIKTGAPAGPRGESWGETHFARSLAAALERLGQYAAVDARPALARATGDLDDVVLSLRGPHELALPPAAHRLLWIISHPDEVTAEEVRDADTVYAASAPWARRATERFGVAVRPLLQCTDAHRFRPQGLQRTADLVFVGTARGIARPSVVEPVRAGRPVRVYGPDWRGYIPGSAIAATHIANDRLPAVYEAAGAVLNDHWPAMQREGFVSNRLFDVVAAGGRAISDEVDGIAELFGSAVRTYADVPALLELTAAPLDTHFGTDAEIAERSERIRAEHSFDARARTLLDDVMAAAARI